MLLVTLMPSKLKPPVVLRGEFTVIGPYVMTSSPQVPPTPVKLIAPLTVRPPLFTLPTQKPGEPTQAGNPPITNPLVAVIVSKSVARRFNPLPVPPRVMSFPAVLVVKKTAPELLKVTPLFPLAVIAPPASDMESATRLIDPLVEVIEPAALDSVPVPASMVTTSAPVIVELLVTPTPVTLIFAPDNVPVVDNAPAVLFIVRSPVPVAIAGTARLPEAVMLTGPLSAFILTDEMVALPV